VKKVGLAGVNGVGLPANRVLLRLVFFVVDGVSFGQHALMQNARNENTGTLQVKHNVPFMLQATQPRKNMVTDSTKVWIGGKDVATSLDLVLVTGGLYFTPSVQSINANAQQVRFSATRETKRGHLLAWGRAKLELSTDTRKYVARSDSAGMAFINGSPQRGKLYLVLLLLAFQRPQRSADNLARILVASALNFLEHEAIKLAGQVDVAGWHGVLSCG